MGQEMQHLQVWVRERILGDLSYLATGVTVLALGFHYAGHMTSAAVCGVIGAALVALKYRAKRRAVKTGS